MNQEADLKKQVVKSIAWLGGMKYLSQIISWAITILVIRILSPGDYGLMAMASVCIEFLMMISELGLGAAIIQKKELKNNQLSQIFGFVLSSHFLLCLILFFGAPFIATYFSEMRLVKILEVLSANFILLAFYIVPQSLLIRDMNFKVKSLIDLFSTVSGSFTTLALALYGYGVWALVWGIVLTHFVRVIAYNFNIRKMFLPSFKFREIKDFISFGTYTLGARMLWYFYSKADIFIGGRILGNQLLGIYSVALELAQIPLDKFMPIINQVAFPAYARIQSDLKEVGFQFLKASRIGSIFVFPVFWGLLAVAPELLGWLLGEKWSEAVLPVQMICLIMPIRALGSLVSPMLFGIGRVDVNLLYVAIAAVLMPIAFWFGLQYYGLLGLCLAWIFGYSLVFIITLKISLKLIKLSLWDFISNVLFAPFAGSIMMGVVFGVKYLAKPMNLPLPFQACSLTLIGAMTYCMFVFLANRRLFDEVWALVPGKEKFRAKFLKKSS